MAWAVSGCSLLQPWIAPASVVCAPHDREIARLNAVVAEKDAEIENLQVQQNLQAKALTQTTGEVARAEVKLRRLATQADAASHLAEVEVSLQGMWAEVRPPHAAELLAQAQRILDAGETSFRRGDYGTAVELAAQSQVLIEMVSGHLRSAPAARSEVEMPFQVPVALITRRDSNLRAGPGRSAALLGVLPKETPVQADAYQDEWLRVRTEDGRTGWVSGSLLEAPHPVVE
jgi:uncharacterized coiled-coil protein SlyX